MNAVGADQYLSGNTDAFFESCFDVLAVIGKINQTMSDVQAVRWQSTDQHL
jgi:hypothetical protein